MGFSVVATGTVKFKAILVFACVYYSLVLPLISSVLSLVNCSFFWINYFTFFVITFFLFTFFKNQLFWFFNSVLKFKSASFSERFLIAYFYLCLLNSSLNLAFITFSIGFSCRIFLLSLLFFMNLLFSYFSQITSTKYHLLRLIT